MAIQANNTTIAPTSSATSQRALISDYNDAVRDYRTHHARSFLYAAGAIDADMSAIDRAAALFVSGLKALIEAVDGTDLINGDIDVQGCIASTLESFVEALPNDSATRGYVDAICCLIANEQQAMSTQSQQAA